jgi:hypothetical protein
MNLKESSGLIIRGKELVEDEPIPIANAAGFFRRLTGLKSQVVEPSSAALYFSNLGRNTSFEPQQHREPESREAIQHRILLRFVDWHQDANATFRIVQSSCFIRPLQRSRLKRGLGSLRILQCNFNLPHDQLSISN